MDEADQPGRSRADDDDRPPAERVVDLTDPAGLLGPGDGDWLCAMLERAIALLGAAGEVRLKAVGDAEMDQAHRRYCDTPGTTDVLTFDLSERPGVLDTDILLCVDEASRRAGERGHETRRELLLYALHGVLHCLGHDDHDDESFARMHAAEDDILTRLGVGPTFGDAAAGVAS